MDEMKKPAVRFQGFSDEWEQRKLGECFGERIESLPDGELLSVTINGGVKRFCELGRNDTSNDDKSKYKKVCIGDIAYNSMRMWQGASGYSPYEGIVSPAYTVLYPHPGVNSRCIAYQFKLPAIIHAFQINSQGITSDNWNLKYPSLSKIAIHISADEREQGLIAKFFSHIDTLITIHQRKYKKLQSLKASMLEKMFPKDGADVPEVRFKGFDGAWEQHIFEEIAIKASTISDSPELPRVEYEDIISGIGQFNKDIRQKKNKKIGIVFHPGDILYGKLRPYLKNWVLSSFSGLAVGDFWVLQPKNVDSGFLYRLVQSRDFDIVANQSTGTKMPRADWKLVSKTAFSVPHSVEEQYQIGVFFQKVDELVILQQQELAKLQSIKKALLEKMLV